jgi:hypothetical protein
MNSHIEKFILKSFIFGVLDNDILRFFGKVKNTWIIKKCENIRKTKKNLATGRSDDVSRVSNACGPTAEWGPTKGENLHFIFFKNSPRPGKSQILDVLLTGLREPRYGFARQTVGGFESNPPEYRFTTQKSLSERDLILFFYFMDASKEKAFCSEL